MSLKLHENDAHAGKILGYSFAGPNLQVLEFSFCSIIRVVFRFVEEGRVAIIAVVHVDDTFAVGLKSRCAAFRDELNQMVPVKNLGELIKKGKRGACQQKAATVLPNRTAAA